MTDHLLKCLNKAKFFHHQVQSHQPIFLSSSLTYHFFFVLWRNAFTSKPYIFYTDDDSIPFTVVESTADFNQLIVADDYPLEVQVLRPFVPSLPPEARVGNNNDTRVVPLMALQVSVFPNMGICIGVTFNHVVADGRAFHHFMRSWVSICRTRRREDLIRSIDMPLLLLKVEDKLNCEAHRFEES
ncbi:hypothetical protein FNV43_RR13511 [Rhamnella rubrinervis]|uniref:Uncharacterized protein n=1 Tax=Rhamnella rubrinervis TaxID=2594499 RepID=A0A8K0H154_9ROSA|nr:hypothetical protein FNV43_RR13511 [Rhamnella rubrinervis]